MIWLALLAVVSLVCGVLGYWLWAFWILAVLLLVLVAAMGLQVYKFVNAELIEDEEEDAPPHAHSGFDPAAHDKCGIQVVTMGADGLKGCGHSHADMNDSIECIKSMIAEKSAKKEAEKKAAEEPKV